MQEAELRQWLFSREVAAAFTDTSPGGLRRQREASLAWAAVAGNTLLIPSSPQYPPLLRQIPDPPPLLFVQGQVQALSLPQIGIVGSRRPTDDGRGNARRFAADLVRAGYAVTSGLAHGIDAESHLGALDAGGLTLAVMGTGPDHIHPKRHAKLAQRIREQGALITEFPPGTPVWPANFPQRNRLISGLAHGVLVVEAALQSGSLITARLAGEQGREVFALPGSIHNPMARGCHQLLRQGATLVETVDDILRELPALLAWENARVEAAASGPNPILDAPARRVLEHIAYDPVTPDTLALRANLPVPQLQGCLVTLELAGLVEARAGGYVRRSP